MTKQKKLLVSCLCVGVLASALGVGGISAVATDGETPVASFTMEQGASVRIAKNADDSTGIRWKATFNETFWKTLNTETAEFGAMVAPATNVGAGELTENTAEAEPVPCTAVKPTFDKNGEFSYYASIVYDELSPELAEKAYAVELTARAYIKIGDVYTFVDDYATTRSMRAVALSAVQNGEVSETDVDSYYGEVVEITQNTGYYSNMDSEGVFENKNNLTGAEQAYVGATPVAFAKTDAGVKISGMDSLTEEKTYTLNVFGADGKVYTQPFFVATKVIDSVEDLSVLYITQAQPKIEGYYVLGCDIGSASDPYIEKDPAGTAGNSPHTTTLGDNGYFGGTFNGNGYAIYVAQSRNGFFGFLNEATIENLALHSTRTVAGERFVLAQGTKNKSVIRNCYFTMNNTASGSKYNLIQNSGANLYMENVVVEATGQSTAVLFTTENKDVSGITTEDYNNVYIIAPVGMSVANNVAGYPQNTVEIYESNLALKNSGNDFTAFTGVWDTTYGIPVWHSRNEQITYTATVNGEAGNQAQMEVGNTATLDVTATIYGVPANVTVSYELTDGDCVSLENNVITASKQGTATVSASVNGQAVAQFTITVTMPVVDKGTVAYYSAMDGKYIAEDNSEKALATLVGEGETIAYALDSKGTRIETADIQATLLESAKTYTSMKEVALSLYTEKAIYNVTLQVSTKVLNEANDLSVLQTVTGGIYGYYLVHNDLGSVESAYDISAQTEGSGANSFKGTFEGNGYTVYTAGSSKFGLFGYLGNPGVIKNLILYNSLPATSPYNGERYALAGGAGSTTIENCYFNLTDNRVNPTAPYCLINDVSASFAMSNVVVEFVNGYHGVKGTLFRSDTRTANASTYYSNVYVIAPEGAKITDATATYPAGTIDLCTGLSEVPNKIVGATWKIIPTTEGDTTTYAFKFNDNCATNKE